MVPTRAWRPVLPGLVAGLIAGCTALPPAADGPRTESRALEHPERTPLGRAVAAAARGHAGLSGFRLLPVGADGFFVRMQLLKSARRTLDVQYFLFEDGDTGKLITDAMREAADRGVRIRMLVDDADFARRGDLIAELDRHPNVEVRIFNPFAYRGKSEALRAVEFLFSARRLDFRMHNKLFVADNAAALVGGRNVGDRYFLKQSEAEFEDDDVFAAGPVVAELSRTFDDYWRSRLSVPLERLSAGARRTSRPERGHEDGKPDPAEYARRSASGEPLASLLSGRLPLAWARAKVVCDSPEGKLGDRGAARPAPIEKVLREAAAAVRSSLLVVSPYFIPGPDGMKLLAGLRERNVRVRVLTNSLESVAGSGELMAFAAYTHYRRPLLEAGVELHELLPLRPGASEDEEEEKSGVEGQFALHAKVYVFDARRVFIGSMNFDPRSMHLNTEVGLLIESEQLARQVAARYESLMQAKKSYALAAAPDGLRWRTEAGGKTVEFEREPARSALQRAKVAFFAALPIDDEL